MPAHAQRQSTWHLTGSTTWTLSSERSDVIRGDQVNAYDDLRLSCTVVGGMIWYPKVSVPVMSLDVPRRLQSGYSCSLAVGICPLQRG
jgi:hypothetical protein